MRKGGWAQTYHYRNRPEGGNDGSWPEADPCPAWNKAAREAGRHVPDGAEFDRSRPDTGGTAAARAKFIR
jgi:hypothetical protein